MEVEFKREMNRNYMVLQPELGECEKYTVRMLTENRIPGLLPFHEKRLNGDCRYYYDITSKQPLERILEYRRISGPEIRQLITDLLFVLKQMERFLLDESQICLEPELVYVEPDTFHSSLCMIPGRRESFSDRFCELAQYLLDHVNHSDGEAVVLAFGIFRESRKKNFGIEDIEACLRLSEGSADIDGTPEVKIEEDGEEKSEVPWEKETWGEEVCTGDKGEGACSAKKSRSTGMWPGLVLMVMVPVCVGSVWGLEGVFRYKWILGAIELMLAALLIFLTGEKAKPAEDNYKPEEKQSEEWEVYFQEKDQKPERDSKETLIAENDRDEEIQTTLLAVRPVELEAHRLIPVAGGPEIPIHYFPFLIGKSKSITDFCLDFPEISRLHLKIETTASGYTVTDLNSTNGTCVNGKLLEANGVSPLAPGDELTIATKKYRFL